MWYVKNVWYGEPVWKLTVDTEQSTEQVLNGKQSVQKKHHDVYQIKLPWTIWAQLDGWVVFNSNSKW